MRCLDQLIACENFLLFKRMMIQRNTRLNQYAINEIANQGEEVPESVDMQAMYDAEEAELQRAIEESKAMMEIMEAAEKETPKEPEPKLEPSSSASSLPSMGNPQSKMKPEEVKAEKEDQE